MLVQKPIITEKSMKLAKQGVYTFMVEKLARKNQIAERISRYFKVDVISIRTANFKDEVKIQRSRKGKFLDTGFKKAIVKVKAGQKIDIFEPEEVEKEEEQKPKEKKNLLSGNKVKVEKAGAEKKKDSKEESIEENNKKGNKK